jgi:TolB protein
MRRPLLVAARLIAMTLTAGLGLGGTAVATAGVHGHHAQPARMLTAGQTASRSAVPWSKVGPGWALVTYTTATPFAVPPKRGSTTLYLVDPAGGKYVMYRWPHVNADGGVGLLAWSGDGTRAMLAVPKSPTSTTGQLDQLTLAKGILTRLPLPASAIPISYTRPDGLAVLAYRMFESPPQIQLVRYSLSGGLEKVLYTQTGKSGAVYLNLTQSSPYNPAGTVIAATVTPAGSTPTAGHTVLIGNAGGLIRRYRSADSCLFARWWTTGQLLTSNCASKRLFVTPAGGARPAPLTPATTSSFLRLANAWLLAGHMYVQQYAPACGTGSLAAVRNGRLVVVPVPKIAGGASIVTASTSKLLIVEQHCMGSSGLLWFNPLNKAEVRVLVQNQGQGVIGWVPYYELNRG